MAEASRAKGLTRRALLGAGLAAGAWTAAGSLGSTRLGAQEKGPSTPLHGPQPIEIRARPLPSFRSGSDTTRFGDLQYRGGLVLSSPAEHFGGWSGLAMDPEGRRLLAVSDEGFWLSARIDYAHTAPAALVEARIGPLLAPRGRPLREKAEQDAESLALAEGTLERGTLLIGFERKHRIGRYPVRDGEVQAPTEYLSLPPEAGRMPANQGLEVLTVIRAGPHQGSVLAFAERYTRGSGFHTGWILAGGRPQRLQLRDIDGFNLTDGAALPDGGVLILERYFRWSTGVKMRIRRLTAAEIKPGARITGHTVFEGDASYEIDNMENIAVHRGARGETVVTLMSDDNFNRLLQRTVFLQFTLVE